VICTVGCSDNYGLGCSIGYNASRNCNCSDKSLMLNCGEKINSGEMYSDQLYKAKRQQKPHSVTCITTEDIIPQLPYDLTIVVSKNILNTGVVENRIDQMELSSSRISTSTLSRNVVFLDSCDASDEYCPISATFIRGSIEITFIRTYI
jgi:hypothetical protein